MAKLAHIAVKLDGMKTRVAKEVTELYKLVQKPAMFQGYVRTYEPYTQSGDRAETLPPEQQLVQVRAKEVLAQAAASMSELINLTYQQDIGNTEAKADIVVDGVTLAKQLPVTSIMFLIKRLTEYQNIVAALPIPDASIAWEFDNAQGQLRSKEQKIVQRTSKLAKVIKKFEPTDKQAGQADIIYTDIAVGEFKRSEFSGALPQQKKQEILAYIDKYLAALKEARATANMNTNIKEEDIAKQIFGFILAPLNKP